MTVPVTTTKTSPVELVTTTTTTKQHVSAKRPTSNASPAVLSVMNIRDAIASIAFIASFVVPFSIYAPALWSRISQYPELSLFFIGSFGLTTAVFWSYSLVLAVLDLLQIPASFWKYRVQPSKIPMKSWYIKAGKQALFNWIFVNFPTGIAAYGIVTYIQRRTITTEALPTLDTLLVHLAAFAVIEEIGFYYSHRLFHHPRIYKYIHKRHHEFTAPIGCLAIYAHPIEHLIANLAPLFAGPLIMQSHIMVFWLWLCIGLVNTINSHCGFALPFMPSPLDHDYHHQVFNANYGVLGVLDTLHSTRGGFETWRGSWRPACLKDNEKSSTIQHDILDKSK
ncbi:hypothetical protein BDF22DRAFT_676825 [Syncephalis plumigaleata]|nr:hypothetical protein BDF22DRAFT_676825 [Syncephalis plumigaleata]